MSPGPAGVDVLRRIADDRRQRIAALALERPAHALRATLGSPPPAGRLERALRRGGEKGALKLLCEIKRASPSKGVLNAGLDPVAMAQVYERGGASAISIV